MTTIKTITTKKHQAEHGFTVLELLVSISIFAVVCAGIVTYISDSLGRVAIETRASTVTQELKNAIGVMQSELRMSHSASPYNVGLNPGAVTCRSAFQITPTTLRFIVSYDDAMAPSGTRTYYVGYQYDTTTNTLFRGETETGVTASCALPGVDPLSAQTKRTIATNVVLIDSDNDGALDNAFTVNGSQLLVRLGVQVDGTRGLTVAHQVTNTILMRIG